MMLGLAGLGVHLLDRYWWRPLGGAPTGLARLGLPSPFKGRSGFRFGSNTLVEAGVTIEADQAVAPDGTNTATRMTRVASGTGYGVQFTTMTVGAETDYEVTRYFKYDGEDVTVSLENNNSGNWDLGWQALFTVTAAGVSAGAASDCTSSVEETGEEGWYRCTVSLTTGAAPGTPTNPAILVQLTTASGDASVLTADFLIREV